MKMSSTLLHVAALYFRTATGTSNDQATIEDTH
jgi:hypothetical protein